MKYLSIEQQRKMAETLEEILDRATDPQNTGDNSATADAFSVQVNKEFDGPVHAIKLLTQKLNQHQDIIALQTLNVLEHCVKNCGQRFHQEIGKYRFLNELIKLLSPKYDGDVTSQAVKDRVVELMYNWYTGLPTEGKITEAYRMLKQQGIIKKDPSNTDPAGSHGARATNTALEDEEKSELLATLLKSTNPEDLQAANRLIKTMVRQEEERLEKFSKRVQELETVSNNVKLLNEMLEVYSTEIPESDQSLMRDLYESCLKMRTQLFRMASQSAEDKDDTLSEILSLSDDLTKSIDEYKRVVIQGEPPSIIYDKPKQNASSSSGDSAPSQPSADSLLDLGLDFDGSSAKPSNSQPETSASSSLLDEQFKILGLDSDITTSASNQAGQQTEQQQIQNTDQWGSFGAVPQQPMQQQQQMNMQAQGTFYTTNQFSGNMNPLAGVNLLGQMASPGNMPATNFNMVPNIRSTTSSASTTGNTLNSQNLKTKQSESKPARNDILDFDVFADFKKDDASKTKAHGAEEEQMKDRGTGNQVETSGLLDLLGDSNTSSSDAFQSSVAKPVGKFIPPLSSSAQSPEKYFVPLEAIEPTSYPPVTILDKDGVKTILNIVKDKRDVANPNVIAVVFSTLSTNVLSISEFKIEISVPKIMRIKLQTPSATTLPPFNPLLPPSAISQIMLIANPSKETIRMQVRVSYMAGSNNISETLSIDGLPVT